MLIFYQLCAECAAVICGDGKKKGFACRETPSLVCCHLYYSRILFGEKSLIFVLMRSGIHNHRFTPMPVG